MDQQDETSSRTTVSKGNHLLLVVGERNRKIENKVLTNVNFNTVKCIDLKLFLKEVFFSFSSKSLLLPLGTETCWLLK